MAGLADNDPAGVATYAIAGATTGYSQLWLILVATFMVQAVQVTSARLGDVAQAGVLALTRRRFGFKLAAFVCLIGLVANEATLIADVAAVGAALQILTGLAWQWFVLPVSLILFVVTVFCNFRWLRLLFIVVGSFMVAYVITAFLAHPDWSAALRSTFLPTLPTDLPSLESAVALLGTTISPYLIFWQAQGEREEHRSRRQFDLAVVDITAGFVISNLVSYFIIVTTAATIHANHGSITTAADAALALKPLLGNLATTVFAIGLLAAGLTAVPMFAISIGFLATELFAWPAGLSKTFRQAPRFYVVLAIAFLSGGLAAVIGVDPIIALFDSQILDGLLTPVLIVLLLVLANDRRVVGRHRNTVYYNAWLVICFGIMAIGAVLLIRSLMSA
jgi:Mn2+/Fe2+ NRAMP family transporter